MAEAQVEHGEKPEALMLSELQTENDSTLPTHSEDGVDLTLIRWMLALSPLERLRTAQPYANSARRLQNARRRV